MIKVDLVTGFLGSGKTTFIKEYAKYLVGRGERVAIIVNDYGAINVDRLLLGEALGDSCHLEMVIGGDKDCSRRRLKTKLISMAMIGYTYVIVEPSGIFDVDDFLDMLYEEPLERWYEMNSILAIVAADTSFKDMSDAARYILASETAKAGAVILGRLPEKIDEETSHKLADSIKECINDCLKMFNCSRQINDIYLWNRGKLSDDTAQQISHSRYTSGEMLHLPDVEEAFDSYFYFHVKTDISHIKETIASIFQDEEAGNVIRLKGFLSDTDGSWLEVNATRSGVSVEPVGTGQELFIVIGENLQFEKIGAYWESFRNGL
ncbi:GTPase, G3E family [Lachnospiraceae bacterium NE2001]|nr:GTPase, G3E family [Lachnospiraceae bacterium NE2001]